MKYSTTNRDGYREYKSCGNVCENCSYLSQCTESKNHVKLITRHIWENYMEQCEDVRHSLGMKKLYEQRKKPLNESLEQQRRIMVFVIHKCMVRLEWK